MQSEALPHSPPDIMILTAHLPYAYQQSYFSITAVTQNETFFGMQSVHRQRHSGFHENQLYNLLFQLQQRKLHKSTGSSSKTRKRGNDADISIKLTVNKPSNDANSTSRKLSKNTPPINSVKKFDSGCEIYDFNSDLLVSGESEIVKDGRTGEKSLSDIYKGHGQTQTSNFFQNLEDELDVVENMLKSKESDSVRGQSLKSSTISSISSSATAVNRFSKSRDEVQTNKTRQKSLSLSRKHGQASKKLVLKVYPGKSRNQDFEDNLKTASDAVLYELIPYTKAKQTSNVEKNDTVTSDNGPLSGSSDTIIDGDLEFSRHTLVDEGLCNQNDFKLDSPTVSNKDILFKSLCQLELNAKKLVDNCDVKDKQRVKSCMLHLNSCEDLVNDYVDFKRKLEVGLFEYR
ncbi:hypothetical protein HK098_001356 [Nowakowskiella sp. JEL0407]|nr:hypothetical protein HK098_001356 [Nowakowskiella sp. JEL0407]